MIYSYLFEQLLVRITPHTTNSINCIGLLLKDQIFPMPYSGPIHRILYLAYLGKKMRPQKETKK